jgi:hypothetical protein
MCTAPSGAWGALLTHVVLHSDTDTFPSCSLTVPVLPDAAPFPKCPPRTCFTLEDRSPQIRTRWGDASAAHAGAGVLSLHPTPGWMQLQQGAPAKGLWGRAVTWHLTSDFSKGSHLTSTEGKRQKL